MWCKLAMPSYPLQSLLSVRRFREDAAMNEVRAAERRLAEAREEVRKKEEELERYRAWRPEEENRRYDAIMGQSMNLEDVAEFRASLGALAEGEQQRVQAVTEAEKIAAQKERDVAAAREAVAEARREAAKIEAHRDIWLAEAKKEAERQEDLEMEEFKAPSGQSDES